MCIRDSLWFWLMTSIALVIGLGAGNFFKPGIGAKLESTVVLDAPKPVTKTIIDQVVPESIFQALSENALIQIVFFSILFGLALASIGEKNKPVVHFLKSVTETMFKVTEYIMQFAPIGVGAAMAAAIGAHGIEIMFRLAKLVGTLYFALIIFIVLNLIAVKVIAKIKLRRTLYELKDALVLAFSTTSSESALPKAIQSMEKLGVPEHIVNFVLPAGYSFNLSGTTLYLALASLFIAQGAGVQMTLSQQIVMMLTLMITSKGVAAVPRASLVVLASTCAQFNLPIEWIAVILGVDEIMDMARTTVNVLGNCLSSVIVAKWEGVLPCLLYTSRCV